MTARPLLDELRHSAAREIAALRQRATEQAEAIVASARDATERRTQEARQASMQVASERVAAARADAARRVSELVLPARAAALDRIFEAAAVRVESRLDHPRLAEALEPLVSDALRYLPDGPVRVRCQARLTALLGEMPALRDRDDASVVVDASAPLGFIAESGDGRMSVDATFARRLARARTELSTDVVRRLDGEPL